MPTMKTSVALKYEGPALDAGRMNVYQAASNMIAFSEFMVAAVKSTYGEAADAHAEVAGFEHGSFVTDLVFTVGGTATTVFTSLTPTQLWEVVKGAFDLWKHLKGSPPAAVKNDGLHMTVQNNYGQIIQVKTDSFNLVLNEKAAEATSKFVKEALGQEGYQSLTIGGQGDVPLVIVDSSEADSFVPVAAEIQLSDNTVKVALTIVAAVFQDGNKWRFNDGGSTFAAAILDGDFLMSVEKGERFGKGDVLVVMMRVIQNRSGDKVTIERSVLKVLDHLTPHEQLPIGS